MKEPSQIKKWQEHEGIVVASANGFDVIDCGSCGFKHIVALPSIEELEQIYRHDYYSREKPLYIERYREDIDWWNTVYVQRYERLERYMPEGRRRLLDIGSGPGFFLLKGKQRGWQVKGIDPSSQAVEFSRGLQLDIECGLFSRQTAPELGCFDAINMSLVLEHILDPAAFLALIHASLNDNGLVCIVVPNDFNPFQCVLRNHLGFDPWWVAPPHHINYFDFVSLAGLVEGCGFQVLHKESTFPIDMFLLMGDQYVGSDEIGRACHKKRMNFELALTHGGRSDVLEHLQADFARQGIGREVVLYAKKI